MPHSKGEARKDKRPYWEVLDDARKRIIDERFAREIETFGYRYGASPPPAWRNAA